MAKKGSWFSALKRAFGSDSNKDQKPHKSKSKKWFTKQKDLDPPFSSAEETLVCPTTPPPPPPFPPPSEQDVKISEAEDQQSKHAYSVALATAVAAEAAVAAAQAAAEVVRLTSVPRYPGKSKEEVAAIKIQTAFRGYLARRALRALRGLVRLKSLIQGQSVKRQANSTLKCMQTLARVQAEIRARRIRMSEENQALQRQLQQKREKEAEKLRNPIGDDWECSTQSKEKLEANMAYKQEAAVRRERALAYSYSHQRAWKNNSKSASLTFMDPNNPHWGWSWLERWMAARPWESRSAMDNNSIKSAASRTMSVDEISKAYLNRDLHHHNHKGNSPTGQKLTRAPSRKSPSSNSLSRAQSISSVTNRTKPPSPRGSQWGGDDDLRSIQSYRRHSIAGSSVRDDESLASSPSVPSYMASTQSAKAKSRLSSPMGSDINGTPEKGSVKKRLSFSASPGGARRHSGPPKVDSNSIKDIGGFT